MIELQGGALVLRFPEVHPDAALHIEFRRTLRIPDDGRDYPLPPWLGAFPLRHVDDFAERVPESWMRYGGVMLPMYQSEALSLQYTQNYYPVAVKVAAGKINAVTGEPWRDGLNRDPQDYLVLPEQLTLDGFCGQYGVVRQFIAMPLGTGYSAEEQVTGAAEWGGLQISAVPLRREAYERRLEESGRRRKELTEIFDGSSSSRVYEGTPTPPYITMGLAPGGEVGQKVYPDTQALEDWDTSHSARCFIHIANSLRWRQNTGTEPPAVPPSAEHYALYGLPWFDIYDEPRAAVEGSAVLAGLKSVAQLGEEKGETPLPENTSTGPIRVVHLRDGLREDGGRQGLVDS